jgi:hypothetical protein
METKEGDTHLTTGKEGRKGKRNEHDPKSD